MTADKDTSIKLAWSDEMSPFSQRNKTTLIFSALGGLSSCMHLRTGTKMKIMLLCYCGLSYVITCVFSLLMLLVDSKLEVDFGKDTTYQLMTVVTLFRYNLVFWYMIYLGTSKRGIRSYHESLDELALSLSRSGVDISTKPDMAQKSVVAVAALMSTIMFGQYISDFLWLDSLPIYGSVHTYVDSEWAVECLRFGGLLAAISRISSINWTIAYFIDSAHQLKYLLHQFNNHLKKISTESPQDTMQRLSEYRMLHVKLYETVDIANNCWSLLLALELLSLTILELLMLYYMAVSIGAQERINLDHAAFVFLLSFAIGLKVFIIKYCHAIYNESIMTKDSIASLTCTDISNEQLAELQLFILRLGQSTGFTLYDTVAITKELALSILGVIISYFIIMVQFQLSQTGPVVGGNGTTVSEQ